MKKNVVVLGLGRIGGAIGCLLNDSNNYQVLGVDSNPKMVNEFSAYFNTQLIESKNFSDLLKNKDAVISALSFNDNPQVAQAALDNGCSYFDLSEDVQSALSIKEIAKNATANQVFMPQCGLAPGFIGILGYSFRRQFEKLDTLKLRVGALPEFPANQMMYNLTWNTEGLVNEYANPCEVIKNHAISQSEPLEGRELLSISGVEYEAFNTSGGLANLCHALKGQVRELTYKTIRYPGHCELMRFLFRDLRLGEVGKRRNMLMDILDSSVAMTSQDLVLISAVGTGWQGTQLHQRSRTFLLRHSRQLSAIQIATSSAAVTSMDIILQSNEPRRGFIEQEDLDLNHFITNEFAKPYRDAELGVGEN